MGEATTAVTIHLDEECLSAVRNWISRSKAPDQSLESAITHLLAKGVGADAAQTTLPPLVTGRDIV
ncbi:MAG: hypothetical protein PGN09_12350 [Sphingomonas fennica]